MDKICGGLSITDFLTKSKLRSNPKAILYPLWIKCVKSYIYFMASIATLVKKKPNSSVDRKTEKTETKIRTKKDKSIIKAFRLQLTWRHRRIHNDTSNDSGNDSKPPSPTLPHHPPNKQQTYQNNSKTNIIKIKVRQQIETSRKLLYTH